MLGGCVRVSTEEQNLSLQLDEFKKAGCEKALIDEMAGAQPDQTRRSEGSAFVRPGDSFVVCGGCRRSDSQPGDRALPGPAVALDKEGD